MTVSVDSPTYPYSRVFPGYNRLRGTEEIPMKVLRYLLDLPLPGYLPKDDNERARVRLAKYLWYDGARPLENPLPTAEEKLSMLFDGEHPVLNTAEEKARHPKGYRVFPQRVWGQSDTKAGVLLKLYLGRTIAKDSLHTVLGLQFEILVNVNMENTTRTDAYARSYDIEQCIIEALHGVNMTGVGVFDFNRYAHPDNGSKGGFDYGVHVLRMPHLSLEWCDSHEDAPDGGTI